MATANTAYICLSSASFSLIVSTPRKEREADPVPDHEHVSLTQLVEELV